MGNVNFAYTGKWEWYIFIKFYVCNQSCCKSCLLFVPAKRATQCGLFSHSTRTCSSGSEVFHIFPSRALWASSSVINISQQKRALAWKSRLNNKKAAACSLFWLCRFAVEGEKHAPVEIKEWHCARQWALWNWKAHAVRTLCEQPDLRCRISCADTQICQKKCTLAVQLDI